VQELRVQAYLDSFYQTGAPPTPPRPVPFDIPTAEGSTTPIHGTVFSLYGPKFASHAADDDMNQSDTDMAESN
jgi:hypothetical protein